jgi:hypothetical protein
MTELFSVFGLVLICSAGLFLWGLAYFSLQYFGIVGRRGRLDRTVKICRCVLAGGNREKVGPESLKSSDAFADHTLLVRTDETADALVGIARDTYPADRLIVVPYPKGEFLCAVGRNLCLDEAHKLGADWALLQDTDIRLSGSADGLREFLAKTNAPVVSFLTSPEKVAKAMLWRLPRQGYFDDEPHEWYRGLPEPPTVFPGVLVHEVQRTPDEWAERGRQVAAKLEPQVKADPTDWRKTWYLAEAYRDSGQADRAVNAYWICFRLLGEQGDWAAWCLWRVACLLLDSQPEKAMLAAVRGQQLLPDWPEFWWLAGVAADRFGQPELAERYACEAARLGPAGRKAHRPIWSYRPAAYHAPYNVLEWACRSLGLPKLADQHRWQHDRLLERYRDETGC